MSNARKAHLEARLHALHQERLGKEMSDDFAYTNGSIRRIDQQIAEVQRLLAAPDQVAA